MTLLELLNQKPELILLDATERLVRAHLEHYTQLNPERIRTRFMRLFQSLVKAIETNSSNEMVKFMEIVSDERFETGYELSEVQTAINILEETVWRKISIFVDEDKQAASMKQVTGILTKAKEELANEFVLMGKEFA